MITSYCVCSLQPGVFLLRPSQGSHCNVARVALEWYATGTLQMYKAPPASLAPAIAETQHSTGNAGRVVIGASRCRQGCCTSGSEWQVSPPAAASLSAGSPVGSPDDVAGSQEAANVGAQSMQGAQHMAWEPVASHQHCERAVNSLFEAAFGIMMSSIDIDLQQAKRCSSHRLPVQVDLASLLVCTRCP